MITNKRHLLVGSEEQELQGNKVTLTTRGTRENWV